MRNSRLHLLSIMLFCLLASGCSAQRSTFVLLPDPGGKVGAISVTNSQGTQTLNQARQTMIVNSKTDAPGKTETMDEKKIRSLFEKVIAIEPPEPTKFILSFKFDSIKLRKDSEKLLDKAVETARSGKSLDIRVSGHTDRSGNTQYNYALSLRRAQYIQESLEKRGIDPDIITTTSHGEGDPLVPTANDVYEPRNRRVEVTIR